MAKRKAKKIYYEVELISIFDAKTRKVSVAKFYAPTEKDFTNEFKKHFMNAELISIIKKQFVYA